jgi:hypothetical protein
MSQIVFRTSPGVVNDLHYYVDVVKAIADKKVDTVSTTCLNLLSFDLLDRFDRMYLLHGGKAYELKLGRNDWTNKELRKEHNLLKLVTANILNQ